ncbi:Bug family tripartite tricarboxylate transporter substrate binding protein [Paradesulfitobacterium ferrireducens]|uniref:Bug family tripartite tricarboxylate transporter substrate binding protein n=1 Tax=Paradesulfitobacterium ferrireducens TaxID=2816476 RepID=UPI001A90514D|nr:tripartite tricarboxylate transporter substrate-binding protein [Paradesulfitobacterium ferrireducens]
MRRFWRTFVSVLMVGTLALSLAGCQASEKSNTQSKVGTREDALAFYKDKNLNFIVPYNAGGGYDQYARLLAQYIPKYIPGLTVVVRNVPGGGSLTGTNELYLAKADGLTIGILNGVGMVADQAAKQAGVKFDLNKFTWLGRLNNEPKVMIVDARTNYKSIEDLKKDKNTLKFATNGVGSSEYVTLEVTKKLFLPQMDIVSGYNTAAEYDVSMLRGEVLGSSGSVSSRMPLIEQKKAVPVLLYGLKRDPAFPDVPLATEITTGQDKDLAANFITLLELGRDLAAPPAIPQERADLLREAIAKSLADPELVSKAKQAKLEISPLSGPEIEQLMKQSLQMPDDLKTLITKALAG